MKLRSYDDLDELEKLAIINVSYSRLDTYDMCPSKYFFTYIQKEERNFGAAATMGNVIHSVLEDHVGEELILDEMLESMSSHQESYDPEGMIDDVLVQAGEVMLSEFVDRHGAEEFDIIGKELPFEIVVGSALVRGFIDLVIRDNNGLIRIIDYKSGKHEITYNAAPDNLQIGIYALAAHSMFPEEEQIYGELYYLRSGRRKGHTFSIGDMENVYDRVVDKVNNIISDQHFLATNDIRPCLYFCDFAENKVCKAGVMRRLNR